MKILEVYKKYKIMPQLAEHQFKVAGAGKLISENINRGTSGSLTLNTTEIITACLLHDMGNIIKFNLNESKSLLNTDLDLNYWQKVKDEYLEKYGSDEHIASIKIIKELGVSQRVIDLVDCVGFTQAEDNLYSEDLGKKICAYADMRVGPKGVISLQERFFDLRVRYAHRANEWGGKDKREIFEKSLIEIERQLFEESELRPEDISESVIAAYVLELKEFEI